MMVYKRRTRNLYQPGQSKPFRISRSKVDLYLECPKCFYLDRRLGFGRPSMPGWSLNSAVDQLLKTEFDLYRKKQQPHPLMKNLAVKLVPFQHHTLPVWRDDVYTYTGASFIHQETNLELCGIIDDIWSDKHNNLYIVDYKSTSTTKEISLDDQYKQGYKLQMEWYQWLFRQLGFTVSNTGYFVFANGIKDKNMFDAKLEFDMSVISYQGDDSWVVQTIQALKQTLESNHMPEADKLCEYCSYRELIQKSLSKLPTSK